ncbi:hypothetical protein EVAR_14295_1 [Eumeta japonica]|uniref:Uncharacterized protein n=1 Tax=Eumeta variegata TaxID=151549 RepID=A0A4C1UNR0_EUMVA|nr:hypothetical protein EVAR_14295_1 [Eumeta japonica]
MKTATFEVALPIELMIAAEEGFTSSDYKLHGVAYDGLTLGGATSRLQIHRGNLGRMPMTSNRRPIAKTNKQTIDIAIRIAS